MGITYQEVWLDVDSLLNRVLRPVQPASSHAPGLTRIWKAEKGRGMNKCKLGGGVGCIEGTNSGFDTKLVLTLINYSTPLHYALSKNIKEC